MAGMLPGDLVDGEQATRALVVTVCGALLGALAVGLVAAQELADEPVVVDPVTREWVPVSWPETDGVILHATEVGGILEEEVRQEAADLAGDRYRSFARCLRGPHRLYVSLFGCWPTGLDDRGQDRDFDSRVELWVCRVKHTACMYWDADRDLDVDLHDFAAFQPRQGG